jgi:hypothetical protein
MTGSAGGVVESFGVKPFDLKRDFIEPEDGVATIDWVVLLAALVGLGYAIVDRTSTPLGDHSRTIRGELQDTGFETDWLDNLQIGGSGEGIPGVISTSDSTADTTGSDGADTDDDTADDDTAGGSAGGGNTTDGLASDGTNSEGTTAEETGSDGTSGSGSGDSGPIVPASNVQGCPNSAAYIATPIVRTGGELASGEVGGVGVTVGGASENLVNCADIAGLGYFYANPTYTLDLSEMDGFWGLTVRVASSCNSVLLVQDANGAYVYDDNSGSEDTSSDAGTGAGNDLDALVRIFDMDALEGRVNVWVGTANRETCSGTDVTVSLR